MRQIMKMRSLKPVEAIDDLSRFCWSPLFADGIFPALSEGNGLGIPYSESKWLQMSAPLAAIDCYTDNSDRDLAHSAPHACCCVGNGAQTGAQYFARVLLCWEWCATGRTVLRTSAAVLGMVHRPGAQPSARALLCREQCTDLDHKNC